MSEAEKQDNKQPEGNGAGPTRSFDGSVLGPGAQIGPFRIEQELGRGAAGIVYLAHDTKLDRSVAIKSLPAELMENPKARTRFAREARVLASLNHPNIATIYDELGEADGVGYLVLEYVPGQTLAEWIAGTRLKPQEALSIAQQIAEAVAAAHEHEVIHRDLKPGNIKITPDGKVKVLDFGLAKAVGGQAADILRPGSGREQSTVTDPGRAIGTPAYMSPEQARGLATDKRCDIWSFGCVLYEMLTGKVPFEGQTVSDTLAGILDREPDWRALPEATPANIRILLRRCLEKDPHRRLHDIADAAIEINETLNLPATAPPVTTPSSPWPHVVVKARSRRTATVIGATAIVIMVGIALWLANQGPDLPLSKEIRLVVLPFENRGAAADEYFAAGIADAINAHLSPIRGLAVMAPQTAIRYKQKQGSAQQRANDLRLDYVLEGTVQRERPSDPTSRVRITPRLTRAADDIQVWADTYDFDMSEVFTVQSDLAARVAQRLNTTLVEGERWALRFSPTENMEAYEYFLQGNEYWRRGVEENDLKIAIQMYERAVALDPKFASAYAQLSRCHASMYWQAHDRTLERLELARKAVDEARRLDPHSPQTHLALGQYYYCQSDWERALKEFTVARQDMPNDSDLLSYIGFVQRRQGKFEEALANIKRASELNPLSDFLTQNLGETFMLMRNYPQALRCFDRAISLAPDLSYAYDSKAWLYLRWEGNMQRARAVVEEALKNVTPPEESSFADLLIALDVYEGNYPKALDRLSSKSGDVDNQFDFVPRAMRIAGVYGYMNEAALAKEYYQKSQIILEAKIQQEPNDARFHSALGIVYAGLGRKQDAIRRGESAVKMLPVSKEAMKGFHRCRDLARIYVMVDEFDSAINQLESLLSIPGDLSGSLLRLDPAWAPLRTQPRFKKLLEEK